MLKIHQLLYPEAKPSAMILYWALAPEEVQYLREQDIRTLIQKHIEAGASDIKRLEGRGAMNFLALDALLVTREGEPVDPRSVIVLPHEHGIPECPVLIYSTEAPLLRTIAEPGKKWVVFSNGRDKTWLANNTNEIIREVWFAGDPLAPLRFRHCPSIVRDIRALLGNVQSRLMTRGALEGGDVIVDDLVLVWSEQCRVITGFNIPGRLLRGVSPAKSKLIFK